jgi:alcohol dehydrogenase class IV
VSQEDYRSKQGAFDFAPRTRIVFGLGALAQLGTLASELGGRRVLVVTDSGIAQAGHVDRAERLLSENDLECVRFEEVVENPSESTVEICADFARKSDVDLIVGLGGGSSLDTAKGCNFLLADGGRMRDFWGIGKVRGSMLPLIAVPTTAGTGSECQSFALISHEETHAKMACGDRKATAAVALLDPELTRTQPARVAACTGVDALAHALESAVSRRAGPISQMLSREAFANIVVGLRGVLSNGGDLDARGSLLLGASLAGLAIENSMLGAAHASANPLTVRYGITHGQAVGWMLPAVIRFNSADSDAAAEYDRLVRTAGLPSGEEPAETLARLVEEFVTAGGLAEVPSRVAADEAERQLLAAEAAPQWTGQFNPRALNEADFAELYRTRFDRVVEQTA